MKGILINNPRKYTKQIVRLILNELGKKYKMEASDIKSLLEKLSKSIPEKIQSKDYLENGIYPVIDQGKTFIGGYSNKENAVINFDLPLIIFGDHTKQIKYIDFPFVQGADGVKLLKNKEGIYTKFFYYLLHTANIEDRGYSRHYKYLCSSCVVIPKIEDKNESILLQKGVADFLDAIFTQDCDFDYNFFDLGIQNKVKDFLNIIRNIENELQLLKKNEQLIKRLKSSILQDAIQGKLVPQEPNDEPASILMREIQEEKTRLIAEGKLKKQKPLTPIKPEEIPYELPKGWEWVKLGEIALKVTDGFHNVPQKLQTGYRYISATHIRENGINWNDCLYIGEKDFKEIYKKTSPKRGDILITNRGAGCGTPVIVDIDELFGFQNAAIVGFNQSYISSKYLNYFLLFNRKGIMEKFVSGGLQPMLSNVTLATIPVPLPSFQEQLRIIEKIDELMSSCELLDEQVKQLKYRSEKLMESVLQGVLNG